MRAYLSFATDTARERQLLQSAAIGAYVYAYAKGIIDSSPMLRLEAVLAGGAFPLRKTLPPALVRPIPRKERASAERESICAASGDAAGWNVVVRPLHGRVSLRRLLEFCTSLEALEAEPSQAAPTQAVSVVPFMLGAHPLWQCRAASHVHKDGASIKVSHFSATREMAGKGMYTASPEPHAACPAGSQDVQSLYHDDGALYAFRRGAQAAANAPVQAVAASSTGYLEALPVFFRLPFYEMDPNLSINVCGMEKLTKKTCASS